MQWNLEQIRLFVSVAEGRSFSAVGREMRRAQSAVSGAIAALEDDLGVVLFERSSGKQPKLTEAGAAMLEEAREVLRQCQRLDGRAKGLVRGEEVRLRLALDEAMPYQPVLDSLEDLARVFPMVEMQLTNVSQGDVALKVVEKRADLGLLFRSGEMPGSLERQRLGLVEMVTVCGVGHPLATLGHVDLRELARHRQLLLPPQDNQHPDSKQLSPEVWRTDSFYQMAELLMRNLGWAWLPRHVVQYPTYRNHLIELTSDWSPPSLVVELVCRRDESLGPAARWLADCLGERLRAIG